MESPVWNQGLHCDDGLEIGCLRLTSPRLKEKGPRTSRIENLWPYRLHQMCAELSKFVTKCMQVFHNQTFECGDEKTDFCFAVDVL